MKTLIVSSSTVIVSILFSLTCNQNALGQEYVVSTPISGFLSMSVRDLNGPADSLYNPLGSSGAAGGIEWNFGTLTEHVYVDTVNQTIRQVGTLTGAPAEPNIVIQETQGGAAGTITVYVAPSGGNVVSFDTGPQAMTWNSGSGSYSFNGDVVNLGTFNGSWTLATGSETFGGSFDYTSSAYAGLIASTFTHFMQLDANSIALSGLTDYTHGTAGAVRYGANPSIVADVTAANGFHMTLSPGAGGGYGVYGDVINWSLGTVTATLVPEPGTLALLGIGLTAMLLRARRRS